MIETAYMKGTSHVHCNNSVCFVCIVYFVR